MFDVVARIVSRSAREEPNEQLSICFPRSLVEARRSLCRAVHGRLRRGGQVSAILRPAHAHRGHARSIGGSRRAPSTARRRASSPRRS